MTHRPARFAASTLLALCATAVQAQTAPSQLVWMEGDKLVSAPTPRANPAAASVTPLGSTWKLFVFSYLVAQGIEAPPYRCRQAERRDDETYCCDPGEAVTRDDALARSCGAFFEPGRLKINATDWRRFWQRQQAPEWLLPLSTMQPATPVPVPQLLAALRRVPDASRIAAREALLPNSTRDADLLGAWGSGPRFKTWSWTAPNGERVGGAAGWLADGAPFWLGSRGTSHTVLAAQSGAVAQSWQSRARAGGSVDAASVRAQPCVVVQMFARYPLRDVLAANGTAALDGPLQGRYTVRFANGESLPIQAVPALSLSNGSGGLKLQARLALEDYVARVVDREGDARETAAARALAVAARTWLLSNSAQVDGCYAVADDSRAQRVSPNEPSPSARSAAAFTDGLVLVGMPVRYHRDRAAPGVMSWADAVAASRAGVGFQAILRKAYPQAVWAGTGRLADCEPLPEAAAWLRDREQRWRARLRNEIGFEPQAAQMQVCRLALGAPHSDMRRLQIRLREWQSREGRVTLVHEYLHLAFRHHPRGADEAFVERLAQQLVDA